MSGKGDQPQNDSAPLDPREWRRAYMRKYMRAKRERLRREKENQDPPKDQAS